MLERQDRPAYITSRESLEQQEAPYDREDCLHLSRKKLHREIGSKNELEHVALTVTVEKVPDAL